jgi:predicted RNase H-like nuclease (RuvC/YqgF family)
MRIKLNGTGIEVYNLNKVYFDQGDISEILDRYKEEIFHQLVNYHIEETAEELLKYGLVLCNRNLDEVYLKYFGKLFDELSSIKQYYEKEAEELEEMLAKAMDKFFKERDNTNELRELENKIYCLQSKVRDLKLNAIIMGIASLIRAYLSSRDPKYN